jgi:hypothetical protein
MDGWKQARSLSLLTLWISALSWLVELALNIGAPPPRSLGVLVIGTLDGRSQARYLAVFGCRFL